MGLELRTGNYGEYWGNTYDSSNTIDLEKMKINATYIWKCLNAQGWTLNAVCGMLGNMQSESAINPGRWQSDRVRWNSIRTWIWFSAMDAVHKIHELGFRRPINNGQ